MKIPTKNYIILAVLLVIVVFVVLYARSWYITTKQYYANNSVIMDEIKKINQDELGNYILENPKFILYVSSGQNGNIKNFEKNFKKFIRKNDIHDYILYMNYDEIDKIVFMNYLKNLAPNQNIKNKISNSDVSMYIFENGKIQYVINNGHEYSIKQLELLLEKYGIIDE